MVSLILRQKKHVVFEINQLLFDVLLNIYNSY